MFLLRDGLLTLMYIASLIVLINDIFVVIQSAHRNSFIEYINSIDQSIQFTLEDSRTDGSMPSLDTLVIP